MPAKLVRTVSRPEPRCAETTQPPCAVTRFGFKWARRPPNGLNRFRVMEIETRSPFWGCRPRLGGCALERLTWRGCPVPTKTGWRSCPPKIGSVTSLRIFSRLGGRQPGCRSPCCPHRPCRDGKHRRRHRWGASPPMGVGHPGHRPTDLTVPTERPESRRGHVASTPPPTTVTCPKRSLMRRWVGGRSDVAHSRRLPLLKTCPK